MSNQATIYIGAPGSPVRHIWTSKAGDLRIVVYEEVQNLVQPISFVHRIAPGPDSYIREDLVAAYKLRENDA